MIKLDLLIHNIRSVYNVASIFRTAECLGVDKIWLSGYSPCPIDRFGRERADFAKVSLGAHRSIEWEQVPDVYQLLNDQQSSKQILGLEQSDDSVLLKDFVPIKPDLLLIPGTETTGLDSDLVKYCDQLIEIGQRGQKESLNVHAATSIAIWRLMIK